MSANFISFPAHFYPDNDRFIFHGLRNIIKKINEKKNIDDRLGNIILVRNADNEV